MDIDDPRPYAQLIQEAEKTEFGFEAHGELIVNLYLIIYNRMCEFEEGDIEMSREEAEQYINGQPMADAIL